MAVYCFSGSGNSYFIARNIADDLNVELINVMHTVGKDVVIDEDEMVGVIFPTYDFKPPQPVMTLLGKIRPNDKAYVFLVATYGVGTLNLLKSINKDLGRDLRISGAYSVPMPHNAVGSANLTVHDLININADALKRLDQIIEAIHNRVKLDLMTTSKGELVSNKYVHKMLPPVFGFFKDLVFRGVDSFKFTATDACTNCQTCLMVCPTRNIDMNKGKPSWGDNCLSCFACVNWCPERAVTFGGRMIGVSPYTHPKVTPAEFIRFNQGDI